MDPLDVAKVQRDLLTAARRCIAAHSPSWWSALFTSHPAYQACLTAIPAYQACLTAIPDAMKRQNLVTPEDAALFLLIVRESITPAPEETP